MDTEIYFRDLEDADSQALTVNLALHVPLPSLDSGTE